jgi:hypothetical protein
MTSFVSFHILFSNDSKSWPAYLRNLEMCFSLSNLFFLNSLINESNLESNMSSERKQTLRVVTSMKWSSFELGELVSSISVLYDIALIANMPACRLPEMLFGIKALLSGTSLLQDMHLNFYESMTCTT